MILIVLLVSFRFNAVNEDLELSRNIKSDEASTQTKEIDKSSTFIQTEELRSKSTSSIQTEQNQSLTASTQTNVNLEPVQSNFQFSHQDYTVLIGMDKTTPQNIEDCDTETDDEAPEIITVKLSRASSPAIIDAQSPPAEIFELSSEEELDSFDDENLEKFEVGIVHDRTLNDGAVDDTLVAPTALKAVKFCPVVKMLVFERDADRMEE